MCLHRKSNKESIKKGRNVQPLGDTKWTIKPGCAIQFSLKEFKETHGPMKWRTVYHLRAYTECYSKINILNKT